MMIMPKYEYICPSCKHEYLEQRLTTDPQFFTKCNGCGESDYVLVENA